MRARVLALIVLLAMSAAAVAQVQTYPWYNSFRNQSTSGLLEDDLDLMLGSYGYLDPARMTLIDGRRLYTNLANIYTKNEEQFNPSDAGTYVIGGTSDIFGYGKLGLLYSQNTYKDRDSLAYDYVYLYDVDPGANPGFDTRDVQKYEQHAQYVEDEKDYFLGWAKQVNDMKVGLAFKRYQYSEMDEYFAKYEETENNIITGQVTYNEAWSDTGTEGNSESENYLGVSVWKPINDKTDISLRLAIGFGGGKDINEYSYTYDESNAGVDSYNETEDSVFTTEYSGFVFSGGGAYVHKWNDKTDTRIDLQYSHMSSKPKSGTEWTYDWHNQQIRPAYLTNSYDSSYTAAVEGENADNDIDFRVRHTAKLNRATFAIGFGLSTGNYEQTQTQDQAHIAVTDSIYYDNPSLPTSSVTTSIWGEQWEVKTTGSRLTWSFPVCVEFDLTKHIVFRLGANHQITNSDSTDTYLLTGGSDMTTIETVHGDGTRTITYSPNPLEEYPGATFDYNYRNSHTDYIYGAGWKVTDNLQLDFMGFAQLTDLTNWKLSAVFKF